MSFFANWMRLNYGMRLLEGNTSSVLSLCVGSWCEDRLLTDMDLLVVVGLCWEGGCLLIRASLVVVSTGTKAFLMLCLETFPK